MKKKIIKRKKEYLAKLEIAANQIDWLYHKSKFHFIRSNYYFDLKDYDKSKESAKIILYQRGNYFIEFKESFEKLTKIYIAENKTDSILIVQNIMSKNIENSILDLSNTVFEVISANTKLEIEKSKSESDKNTSIVLMFLISLLFFSIVVSLFYFKSRKYNKQIKDINKELTYKNTFMQEYVSLVSHDLRSPVSSIISLSKLHQEEESIEEMKNAMWLIEQQGNRSIATISSLVAHYKMKTKQSSNFMRINLYSLLEGIQSAMRTILLKNNIKLDVDIDVEIFINGNREFLHRLFQNLIENSIKFRKIDNPDSNIIIRAEEIDNTIKITIWDNGIGIQPQKLKNIKTNWDNHLSIKSDGFGLPFVKEIMDYHKGEISINSEYGEFTQIDLHFFN